jgi:hypothetical protein
MVGALRMPASLARSDSPTILVSANSALLVPVRL